jgi:O-antigen ligase
LTDDGLRRVLLGAFLLGLAVSITLAQTALALLAARWLWRLATGRARHPWPLGLPFLAFAAASLLAAALSPRPLESLVASKGLLLIAAFYVVLDALPDLEAADRFLMALLALGAAIALIGVLQVALCPWLVSFPALGRVARKCHRAHAFYSIYMTLAGVLGLVLLAAAPRLLVPGSAAPRRWAMIAWALGGLGLAATYVRGAWLGFLAGVAVVVGLTRRGRLVVVAAVVALAVVVVLVPGLRQRAESIVDPSDPTARDRLSMWRSGVAMVRDRPLTGVGPGQVKHEYRRYAEPQALQQSRGHLHNTPLQILVERGVLGLAAWLSIFAAFFLRVGRLLRALPDDAALARALVAGGVAAIAGFLVGGLTEYSFGDSEVVMTAYAIMALPFVAGRSGTASTSRH